jgi:membrane-bound lytic murein transglycosylase B
LLRAAGVGVHNIGGESRLAFRDCVRRWVSTMAGSGSAVSAMRWLRVLVVVVAALLCSWQAGIAILTGVPPPAGDPVPDIDTHAHGRPADQLHAWAAPRAPALGMPATALEAYAYAAKVAAVENPKCHLAWTTLAGIGMVESHHGTHHGAQIAPNGDVTPPIRGVVLDGSGGNLRIIEDGNSSLVEGSGFARAMGPMQIIPQTWRLYGVDAHNNGVKSPDNIDDAALAAAGYLCYRGGDLATPRGWMTALRAYNQSDLYARTVRDWATAYGAGHPL